MLCLFNKEVGVSLPPGQKGFISKGHGKLVLYIDKRMLTIYNMRSLSDYVKSTRLPGLFRVRYTGFRNAYGSKGLMI